jgi:hypothetical protein
MFTRQLKSYYTKGNNNAYPRFDNYQYSMLRNKYRDLQKDIEGNEGSLYP